MTSGASMYAAWMRFDISDSLISGQPLYLLYSYSKSFEAVPALMLAAFAVQATGNVRLQATDDQRLTTRIFVAGAAVQAQWQCRGHRALQQLSSSKEVRAHQGIHLPA